MARGVGDAASTACGHLGPDNVVRPVNSVALRAHAGVLWIFTDRHAGEDVAKYLHGSIRTRLPRISA